MQSSNAYERQWRGSLRANRQVAAAAAVVAAAVAVNHNDNDSGSDSDAQDSDGDVNMDASVFDHVPTALLPLPPELKLRIDVEARAMKQKQRERNMARERFRQWIKRKTPDQLAEVSLPFNASCASALICVVVPRRERVRRNARTGFIRRR